MRRATWLGLGIVVIAGAATAFLLTMGPGPPPLAVRFSDIDKVQAYPVPEGTLPPPLVRVVEAATSERPLTDVRAEIPSPFPAPVRCDYGGNGDGLQLSVWLHDGRRLDYLRVRVSRPTQTALRSSLALGPSISIRRKGPSIVRPEAPALTQPYDSGVDERQARAVALITAMIGVASAAAFLILFGLNSAIGIPLGVLALWDLRSQEAPGVALLAVTSIGLGIACLLLLVGIATNNEGSNGTLAVAWLVIAVGSVVGWVSLRGLARLIWTRKRPRVNEPRG